MRRRGIGDGGIIGILVFLAFGFFLVLCFGGCYGCSKIKSGDGYRESTIRAVRESGIIWKTQEVETLGDGFIVKPGDDGRVTPETFKYTVRDPAVLEQLKALPPGKRVRVYYERYAGVWAPNGESNYIITKVEAI